MIRLSATKRITGIKTGACLTLCRPHSPFSATGRSKRVSAKAGSVSRREAHGLLVALAGAAIAGPGPAAAAAGPRTEVDAAGIERLALQPEGWSTWMWRGNRINYLSAGTSGPPVLLIHGFGASAYHWRYTVPELSKKFRVFAVDLLGFGWSDKPLVEYEGYGVWAEQIADFIREVIGGDEKVVLCGNSLGGYNVTATAANNPELVRGLVLLNAAGRFEESPSEEAEAAAAADTSPLASILESVTTAIKRAAVLGAFIYTKQPARIKQVLSQVYVDPTNIDDDLVASIQAPARDPNAAEVFYRVITARGTPMNQLLARLPGTPMLLLWGSGDPWCVPARATQIQQYYPGAQRVDILSGHCPFDDTPQLVNPELIKWISSLP
jgi:pimeloyl-ACP methyl ester carboxylesterase